MTAYEKMKECFERAATEGSIRTGLPPEKDGEYFNPVTETIPREKLEELST